MSTDEQAFRMASAARRPTHDQVMIAEGIRRMLLDESDIEFHYCPDPKQAVAMALEIEPTIILQDLIMPDIGAPACNHRHRA